MGNGQSRVENLLELEVYTRSPVQIGRVSCPSNARVLDMLNNQFFIDAGGEENFFELVESGANSSQEASKMYVRKSAVQIIAVTDADTGRGIGAASNQKTYPFVRKMPKRVTLDLYSYSVVGNIHCANEQSVLMVLNESKTFLPLTDAVIMDDSGFRGGRPFVAVNKRQITSLREDQYFLTS